MLLSIVIPVYNEKDTILELLMRVQKIELGSVDKEIIVVDDYSTDGTREILNKINELQQGGEDFLIPTNGGNLEISKIKLSFQEENQGKGAALRKGFSIASGDYLIVQDADLEYNPNDIPRLLDKAILENHLVVYGNRFNKDGKNFYLTNYLANRLLTGISNFFSGQKISDMETCYKLIHSSVLNNITLKQDRFGFEPEITAKISKQKIKIFEIPVSYRGRKHNQGKKIGFQDGLNAIRCIIMYNLFD